MIISADYHTHTVFSHGKGQIIDNARKAKELGLKERTLADWRKIFSVNTNFPAAEITKYTGSDEIVEVPGSIEKYSCISIGVKAFYRCETVKAVYLGEGVKTLCYRAFYGCNNLKEIHIPGSVDTICDEAIGKKVKIFAPVGSAAEKYAKEKGNKFTCFSHIISPLSCHKPHK